MDNKELFETLDKFEKIPDSVLSNAIPEQNNFKNIADHTNINGDTLDGNTGANFADNTTSQPYSNEIGQRLNLGNLIDAKLLINLADSLIPALMVIGFKIVAKKKINKSKFSLTAQEKETIQPVLNNYLQTVNFSIESPLNALLLTLGVIYGTKTVEVVSGEMLDEKTETEKPQNVYQKTGDLNTYQTGKKKGQIKKSF